MKKTIESFIETLQNTSNGLLKGGFASIKGGKSLSYPTNDGVCTKTNASWCSNDGDCSATTNQSHCSNDGTCLF
jgi:hypothetical protein